MAIDPSLEITNTKLHIGWRRGKPVYLAFSLKSAGEIFEASMVAAVVCVVPPHAAIAESFESAVQFFSGDDVSERVANLVLAD